MLSNLIKIQNRRCNLCGELREALIVIDRSLRMTADEYKECFARTAAIAEKHWLGVEEFSELHTRVFFNCE
jgi:hypothetical protein